MKKALLTLGLVVYATSPVRAQLPAGELLINSFNEDALHHVQQDGTTVVSTTQETGFLWEGAGVLPDGSWVTTHRLPVSGVNIFDPTTGKEIAQFETPAVLLAGDLDVMSDGSILIVDQVGDALVRYKATGTHVATYALPRGSHPLGVHVTREDAIWVSCLASLEVLQLSADGALKRRVPTTFEVGDVTIDRLGTIWTTHYQGGDVVRFSVTGRLLQRFPTGLGTAVAGIAMAPNGSLWVGGAYSETIENYDRSGKLLGQVPAPHGSLFITVGEDDGGQEVGSSYCQARANSTGASASITAVGSSVAAHNALQLVTEGLPPGVPALLLTSTARDEKPFFGGSIGTLCLGSPLGRYAHQAGHADSSGLFAVTLDLTQTPSGSGTTSVVAGQRWQWQLWYRDAGLGSNFSDAVSVLFE